MGARSGLRNAGSMSPDVFITIAFAGIALLVPLVFVVFVVPQARREATGVRQRESARRDAAAEGRTAAGSD